MWPIKLDVLRHEDGADMYDLLSLEDGVDMCRFI